MDAGNSADRTRRPRLWLLVAVTVILTGWALRATGAFMVPVVFSVFLALLVAPLDRRVAGKVPEKLCWLGHVAAMGAILVALLVSVGMIWIAAQQVIERFPDSAADGSLLPQFGAEVRGEVAGEVPGEGPGEGPGGPEASALAPARGADPAGAASNSRTSRPPGIFARFRDLFSGAAGTLWGTIGEWASGIAAQILRAAGAALGATVLVFFLTLFMLIEGPRWREKLVNVLDSSARRKAKESIRIIGERLRRYLLARTILSVVTAALYAAWLWLFGVDLLVVWALVTFLLNYIPTLGSMIAGVLPVIYALVQKDVGTALAIAAGLFAIEQVMGNYVDPRVQGRQVSLSSLVVLITLLVWGWIWGVAGTILAVPITIAAMIICAHVGPLRPFALMLSNATDMEGLDRQAHPTSG